MVDLVAKLMSVLKLQMDWYCYRYVTGLTRYVHMFLWGVGQSKTVLIEVSVYIKICLNIVYQDS